jgi:hypothetical protein
MSKQRRATRKASQGALQREIQRTARKREQQRESRMARVLQRLADLRVPSDVKQLYAKEEDIYGHFIARRARWMQRMARRNEAYAEAQLDTAARERKRKHAKMYGRLAIREWAIANAVEVDKTLGESMSVRQFHQLLRGNSVVD